MSRARVALSALAVTAILAAPAGAATPTATTGTPPASSSGGAAAPAPGATTPGTPTTTPAPTATTGLPAPTSSPAATTPTQSSATPAAARDGGGPNGWWIALAAVLALLALSILVWGLARAVAWQPRRLAAARHAVGEAAFRTGSTWAELRDWLRLGR